MLEISITGIEEVLDALKELPTAAMEREVLTKSLRQAVAPMVQEANKSAPSELRRRRTMRTKRTKGIEFGSSVRISTRARRGQGYSARYPAFINIVYADPLAHLFEFGTVKRYTKGGAYRGVMTAQPHVRPAYDKHKQQIVDRFSQHIFVHLDRVSERLRKKAEAGKLTKGQIRGLQRSSR